MNKFTIQQLQQMRESEDRVEFKAGEGGNVSYDGRGKTNPKDRRRCILGYVIALCNEGGDRLVFEIPGDLPGLVRPDNIRHTHFSRNSKIAQYLKAYKYVKEFGEGIDRICSELETKGCTIPSFHVDAFILKATLMAEWTTENEFDRSSTVQVPPKNDDTINQQVNITKLSDRQRRIYETIKNGTINDTLNDTINAKVLSETLGASVITVKRDLSVLRDLNLIKYVGSNKTGHWEIR